MIRERKSAFKDGESGERVSNSAFHNQLLFYGEEKWYR